MIWTTALVLVGVAGLWVAPRHWSGWAISAASEILWFLYALSIHAPALAIMACVWFVVHGRNAVVTR